MVFYSPFVRRGGWAASLAIAERPESPYAAILAKVLTRFREDSNTVAQFRAHAPPQVAPSEMPATAGIMTRLSLPARRIVRAFACVDLNR